MPSSAPATPIRVALVACDQSRPGHLSLASSDPDAKPSAGTELFSGVALAARLLLAGAPVDRLTHRGTLAVDGTDYALYLPEAKGYPIRNTGRSDAELENTATVLSIDANGDGRLDPDESWFANLPLRIGDRMFDVQEIAPDGTHLTLRPSAAPLQGAIVGRRMPDFGFATADGRRFDAAGLLGKPYLLDVWSVT